MAARQATPTGVRGPYSRELECARAIAAMLVFARHVSGRMIGASPEEGPPGFLYSFAVGGQTGVTLFFVLSAFLLVPPFLESGGISIRRFFQRRFLRLWPIYAVAVFAAAVWNAGQPGVVRQSLAYLVYGQTFWGRVTPLEPFSSVWWSLATEVQFYIALGLCGLLGTRRTGRAVLTALLVGYAIAYGVFLVTGFGVSDLSPSLSLRVSLFGRGWSFLIGGAAAWLYGRFGQRWRRRLAEATWMRNGGGDMLLAVVVVAIGLLLMKVETIGTWHAEFVWHAWHLPESMLWAAFVLGLLVLPLRTRVLLVNEPLERLGTISYSLYLWHLPIIVGVATALGIHPGGVVNMEPVRLLVGVLLATGLAVAVSSLTYRFIERPMLARKQRVAT